MKAPIGPPKSGPARYGRKSFILSLPQCAVSVINLAASLAGLRPALRQSTNNGQQRE